MHFPFLVDCPTGRADPRAIHAAVDATVMRDDLLDRVGDGGLLCDIHLDELHRVPKLLLQCLALLVVTVEHRDLTSICHQLACGAFPQARNTACHDEHSALHLHHRSPKTL